MYEEEDALGNLLIWSNCYEDLDLVPTHAILAGVSMKQSYLPTPNPDLVHWRLELCRPTYDIKVDRIVWRWYQFDTYKSDDVETRTRAYIQVSKPKHEGESVAVIGKLIINITMAANIADGSSPSMRDILNLIVTYKRHRYHYNQNRSGCLLWCKTILRDWETQGWIEKGSRDRVEREVARARTEAATGEQTWYIPYDDDGRFSGEESGGEGDA